MTDRVKGFTVTLSHDIRIDDVEHIQKALEMVKGVVHVEPTGEAVVIIIVILIVGGILILLLGDD
jgi:NRPS condensation-like uncharacterized protein